MRRRATRLRIPGPKTKKAWVRNFFPLTALDIAAPAPQDVSEFVLLTNADWNAVGGLNMEVLVKRIIANVRILPRVLSTGGTANGQWSFVWAVYVLDFEDTDANLTNPDIVTTTRVLGFGIEGGAGVVGIANPSQEHALSINVDTATNVKLKPDDLLILGVQAAFTLSPSLVDASMIGTSSVLINVP